MQGQDKMTGDYIKVIDIKCDCDENNAEIKQIIVLEEQGLLIPTEYICTRCLKVIKTKDFLED